MQEQTFISKGTEKLIKNRFELEKDVKKNKTGRCNVGFRLDYPNINRLLSDLHSIGRKHIKWSMNNKTGEAGGYSLTQNYTKDGLFCVVAVLIDFEEKLVSRTVFIRDSKLRLHQIPTDPRDFEDGK